MSELLKAETLLRLYSYDRNKASEEGAEAEFLEAETIVEQDRIERYDQTETVKKHNALNKTNSLRR